MGACPEPVARGVDRSSARECLARGLFWSTLGAATVLAALFLGWRLLAVADFGYPLLYELLGIEQTIATYGPENTLRPGFQTTSEAERHRAFSAIAEGVRAGGRGLEAITYTLPGGRTVPLLTAPEITHLQDVATLVTTFERVGLGALLMLPALLRVAHWRRWRLPPARRFALGVLVPAGLGTLAVLALGPVRVFYALHERIFPPDHPWFFWYEESLMSMLMQAPHLFGGIALAWLAFTIPIACGLWAFARRLLAPRAT